MSHKDANDLENAEMPLRPRPGFRPLSRTSSVVNRDRSADTQAKNELDSIPLSDLIKKNFGMKPSSKNDKDDDNLEDNDELVGDTNFEATGVSADFFNVFKEIDEDEMSQDGFVRTNQYLKAEFNEQPSRRFGTRYKKPTPRWKQEETDFFYHVLSMCGTDFSMMSKFFPNRTRKMIVNKYHIEEEKNREKVMQCISEHKPLDLNLYADTVGIDGGSMVEDYKKNKSKLSQAMATTESTRKKPVVNENAADKNSSDDMVTASEDSELDGMSTNKNGSALASDAGGENDEIEGDLDF
ncbi:Myb-like DNA-binding domain containing protein [Tritrichomonas foetus]|uniref:Myb-like DNA-binding domain containing protein n=1 Tax=Tritrichomonas foetus TaxID=1144522 RepID=A0A1J4JYV4_9EUKA|nr:Myb-like DNA-binding domain containing protein [Tritrichomonas foetus]|eukprot:OHT04155.1 Myb-like DNA-binding domain containing protein [Tritrichomonas foetus]